MEADEVVAIPLSESCECGGILSLSNKPYVHQKIDLPEIKPYVVEYQLSHGRCKQCGKRSSSKLPEGVGADDFGPRLKSVVSALSGFYKNSKREIEGIIKDIFNLEISLGSISNMEKRVSTRCEESYNEICYEVSRSAVLHIDETESL